MMCHIGLMSEFKEKHPSAFAIEDKTSVYEWGDVLGAANEDRDELWIFVDRIALLEGSLEDVMSLIIDTTVHEIIHLFGYDENAACFGEKLVK